MREYTREYEEQLNAFRIERESNEERAGYADDVKIYVSSLIATGENANHIATLLAVKPAVVIGWHAELFLNNEDLIFGRDDFTGYRENNLVRVDARTSGCLVKSILEETHTKEQVLILLQGIRANITMVTVNSMVEKYRRDYEIMTTLPPGVEYKIRPAYVLSVEHAAELQAFIFDNDRRENELASIRRSEARAARE